MKKISQLNNSELATFCNQTALLLKSGITPQDGMELLLNDAPPGDGQLLLREILEHSKKGNNFTESLRITKAFPDYMVNMAAIGEESGNLDTVMQSLSEYYEREETIAGNIRSAVTYPFIMIIMMLFIVLVLITKILPLFNQVFIQLGTEMSGFSGSLLRMGSFAKTFTLIIIAVLVIAVLLYNILSKTDKGRILFTRFFSSFPITKSFYNHMICCRFADGMALTLSSGMDTFQSLDLVYKLVEQKEMQEKIDICKQSIMNGDSFAEALLKGNIFSNLYSRMIAIGVKAGSVDVVMQKIAADYEKENDKKVQTFISTIEPTLVIILSLTVGLILMSVILPLLGIMTSIG